MEKALNSLEETTNFREKQKELANIMKILKVKEEETEIAQNTLQGFITDISKMKEMNKMVDKYRSDSLKLRTLLKSITNEYEDYRKESIELWDK